MTPKEFHSIEVQLTQSIQKVHIKQEQAKAAVDRRCRQKIAIIDLATYLIFMGIYFATVTEQFQVTSSYELERAVSGFVCGTNRGVLLFLCHKDARLSEARRPGGSEDA